MEVIPRSIKTQTLFWGLFIVTIKMDYRKLVGMDLSSGDLETVVSLNLAFSHIDTLPSLHSIMCILDMPGTFSTSFQGFTMSTIFLIYSADKNTTSVSLSNILHRLAKSFADWTRLSFPLLITFLHTRLFAFPPIPSTGPLPCEVAKYFQANAL